ncbi:MAG: NADH:flavin oxidoreductase [Clostridiales bacterium]|nr:NADH:flavin oxidoreductase [Clostridiales bacterium]
MKNRLFLPITIKGKNIRNRAVMPPMVFFERAGDDGFVTDEHVEHYRARAKGGTGLIIVEATCIEKNGRLSDCQLGIWSDEHISGLSRIVQACHEYGSVVMLQLHHSGLRTPSSVTEIPVGPSKNNQKPSRALTIDEIEAIKEDFTKAALRAQEAGFDGIELHGAHGQLLNQFVSPVTNQRTDEYGGDLKGRMKLSLDIIYNIKKELEGKRFIIGYRMGGNEPTLKDGIKIAKLLEEAEVDLLHVSGGISSPDIALPQPPQTFPFHWIVYCGTEIKKNVSIPVIVVEGIRTAKQASLIMDNRLADFVSVGRGHLVDPFWTKKAMNQLEAIPCLECKPDCHWFENGDLCPQQRVKNSQ